MNGSFPPLDDDALASRLRILGTGGPGSGNRSVARPVVRFGSVVLDSAVGGLDALRSAATLDGRQLVIQADSVTVAMDLVAAGEEWVVTGQIDGHVGPTVVQFTDARGFEVGLCVVDDLGEFEARLSDQATQLVVAMDGGEIVAELGGRTTGG